MRENSVLDKYFSENKFLFKGFESIDIRKLLSTRVYQKNKKKLRFKDYLRMLCGGIIDYYKLDLQKRGSSLLIYKHYSSRFGFNRILNNVSSINDGMDILERKSISIKNIKLKFNFSYYRNLLNWIYHVIKINVKNDIRIFILCDLCFAYKLFLSLKEIKGFERYKAITVLFDAAVGDNLVVQFAQLNKITTITLQHGHFNFPDEDDKVTPNSSFGGFISDYMLAWSHFTKNEAIRAQIPEEKIIVAGNPFYIDSNLIENERKNYFCVFLDADVMYEENIQMIKIAKIISDNFEIRMKLKFHPSSNKKRYNGLFNESDALKNSADNGEILKEVRFIFACSSSLILEAVLFKTPIFRYKSKVNDVFQGVEFLYFSELEEAVNLMKTYRDNPKKIQENVDYLEDILSCSGNIKKNYENFYKLFE